MKSGAVQHVKSPPRADRLRFVGQADCEATLLALHRDTVVATYAEIRRYMCIERTLATDKERICEAK